MSNRRRSWGARTAGIDGSPEEPRAEPVGRDRLSLDKDGRAPKRRYWPWHRDREAQVIRPWTMSREGRRSSWPERAIGSSSKRSELAGRSARGRYSRWSSGNFESSTGSDGATDTRACLLQLRGRQRSSQPELVRRPAPDGPHPRSRPPRHRRPRARGPRSQRRRRLPRKRLPPRSRPHARRQPGRQRARGRRRRRVQPRNLQREGGRAGDR